MRMRMSTGLANERSVVRGDWRGRIEGLVISAPFGNYVRPRGSTPTLGTFTLARRPGRVWRVLRTVRYSPSLGAWVNKIGLRNPGIEWLEGRVRAGRERLESVLLSVHGFDEREWSSLVAKATALKPLAIELNMSCPNVGHVNWPSGLFAEAVSLGEAAGVGVIVKLPPVNYEEMAEAALRAGVRALHCCNTIPVPAGGVSGKPLKPVAIQCIRTVRKLAAGLSIADLLIIGGGGITGPGDVDDYALAGADRFAIGTKAFNPLCLVSDGPLRALVARAGERARRDRAESADIIGVDGLSDPR